MGLGFHKQLTRKSLIFLRDDNGIEYVSISFESKGKNLKSGLENQRAPLKERMYATGGSRCPVASLRSFLQRTHRRAQSLFNNCCKKALSSPETTDIWYTTNPCKPYTFPRFMTYISRSADCSRVYTADCLRNTCLQVPNDKELEVRHIMYLSDQKNEVAVEVQQFTAVHRKPRL
jgi:hypothetical protein